MQAPLLSFRPGNSRRATHLLLLGTVLAVAGCNPYRCTYETRFVGTSGMTTSAAGTVNVTYVNMREYRDGPVPNAIIWSVNTEKLSAPPARLTLQNEMNVVVATLSMTSSSSVSMTAHGSLDTTEGDPRFAQLTSGELKVVLDLQNGERVTVGLSVDQREDWHRPNC